MKSPYTVVILTLVIGLLLLGYGVIRSDSSSITLGIIILACSAIFGSVTRKPKGTDK